MTLNQNETNNSDGITTTLPETFPVQFPPLASGFYQIFITSDGSPVIDTRYKFHFSKQNINLNITGQRVVVFAFSPDWSQPVTERYEWLTDVMESYNGTEQRLQLRTNPRKQIEYQVLAEGHMANQSDALLWGWQSRVFALPIWRNGLYLNQPLFKGSQSIPIQSLYYDFKHNGLLILYQNENHYEVLEIKQITDQSLLIKRPTQQNWPAGTAIYPVVLARLPQQYYIL